MCEIEWYAIAQGSNYLVGEIANDGVHDDIRDARRPKEQTSQALRPLIVEIALAKRCRVEPVSRAGLDFGDAGGRDKAAQGR